MRRLLLSTAAILLTAQIAICAPAAADYLAAEAALKSGNIAAAVPLLAEEAQFGNPVAAFNLAKIYEDGAAGAPDFSQAATYYRIAAEIDTAPRYNGAALGAQAPQLIAAAQMYGQFALGKLYETGQGVPQDSQEALAWYTRSADLGNAKAMLKLAVIHRDGLPGVPPDLSRSTSWLQRAAEHGSIAAMNELGRAYLNGAGVAPNAREAANWFEQAAAGGSVAAEFNLGLLYKAGIGGQPDFPRAVRHFERGANAKDAASMLALGDLYASGQGLPQDKAQAHAWYSLASDYGAAEGAAKAAGLATGMSPQEQAAATSLHDAWQPGAKEDALPAEATTAPVEATPAGADPAIAVPSADPAAIFAPEDPLAAPDLPPWFEETAPATDAPAPILNPEAATGPAPLPASTPTATAGAGPIVPGAPQPGAKPFYPTSTTGN